MQTALPYIGNSDPDIVILDMACKPFKPTPVRRKIFLWKKADKYKIKEDLAILNITHKNINRNVESMWQAFKTAIQNTIDKRVPSKLAQGRHPSMDKYNHQKKNRSETKTPQKGKKD